MHFHNPLFIPIVLFAIFIFILFVFILVLSVIQYQTYSIVDGKASCYSDETTNINYCKLNFTYKDNNGKDVEVKDYQISWDDIGENGEFIVDVAYKVKDNKLKHVIVLTNNNSTFLGTKNSIIVYSILSFLSLIVLVACIPWKKKNHE